PRPSESSSTRAIRRRGRPCPWQAAPTVRANPAELFPDRWLPPASTIPPNMALPCQHLVGWRRTPGARFVIWKFELAIGPVFEDRRHHAPAGLPHVLARIEGGIANQRVFEQSLIGRGRALAKTGAVVEI